MCGPRAGAGGEEWRRPRRTRSTLARASAAKSGSAWRSGIGDPRLTARYRAALHDVSCQPVVELGVEETFRPGAPAGPTVARLRWGETGCHDFQPSSYSR